MFKNNYIKATIIREQSRHLRYDLPAHFSGWLANAGAAMGRAR